MNNFITSLFYILLLTFCAPHFTKAQTDSADSLALIALYNATNGSNWTSTWDINQPVSTWHGVTLFDGRVGHIKLGGNNLSGSIPAQLENLNELTQLILSGNQLSGNIPPELRKLSNFLPPSKQESTFWQYSGRTWKFR